MSKNSDFVLVSYLGNWADEMDISSATVLERTETVHLDDPLAKYPFRFWFGTNEDGMIKRGDIVVQEIPDGLDPVTLKDLLQKLRLDEQVESMLDAVAETVYEAKGEIWEKEFRAAVLELDDVQIANMKHPFELYEEYKRTFNKAGLQPSIVDRDRIYKEVKEKLNEFESEWLAFMKDTGLSNVIYAEDLEVIPKYSFTVAVNAIKKATE